MRYAQIIERFQELLAARAACSREWRISANVIMCAEFDIYAAARSTLPSFGMSSDIRTGEHPNVRISFFDQRSERIELGALSAQDMMLVTEYRDAISRWVNGQSSELPSNTSHAVADRFRER